MASRPSAHGQQVDGWGVAWPAPPPPSFSVAVGSLLARWLWGWWLELTVPLAACGGVVAAYRFGYLPAAAAGLIVVGALLCLGSVRRQVARLAYRRAVLRRWSRALRIAAIRSYGGQTPLVTSQRRVPAGDVLAVRVPLGGTVTDLEDAAEVLAVALEVREVRVVRDDDNARQATVTIVRRDPLAEPVPAWPHAEAADLSLWRPIPVGVDEDGQAVTISLPERNVLLGGEPGAGKSAALSLLVATAALDRDVRLHLFDGKLVELANWADCAEHSVGVSTGEANLVLAELQAAMDERYAALLANRLRKVGPEMGLPLHVLVVDELAHYLLAPDRKERTEFAERLRDLVARGRAAGFIVLAATQKPAHDIIPTALRDLFGFRWALRCSTPPASDTVLGQGWASAGYSAATIDPAQRGVGLLLHEGGLPVRLRSHYLDDESLQRLAERAERLRALAGALS